MTTDYYEILGLSRTATDDDIKRAYRALARQYHPDSNPDAPDAEAKFKEINLAYETLRDPERRRRYDVFGEDGARPGAGAPGPGEGFGFGDIFDAFFGGAGGAGLRRRVPLWGRGTHRGAARGDRIGGRADVGERVAG